MRYRHVQQTPVGKPETRRRNDRLNMLYRIQHGLVDIHPDSYLQQSDRQTRGEHRLYQEKTGSETYSYSFFPRTIRDWNMLPSGTTSAPTLEGFRAKPCCLPPSVQLLDCQLSMYIVLTDFKLYIYFGPLTTDTPRACQCGRTNYVMKRTQSFTPEEEEEE